jgi:hypothetical protein
VSNSVRNTNANLSSNRNNNLNVSSGGAGGLGGAGGSSNSGGNTMRGGDVSTGAVTQGSVSLTIEGAQPGSGSVTYAPEAHRPVSTATAPGLAAVGNGSCMGSTSVGGQGASVGLSFGTTWKDDDCNARYDAQQLAAMGFVLAAKARLCSRPDIKASLEAAGDTCPVAKAKTAAAPVQAAPVASATSDPFIAMSGRSYPSGAYANK